MQTGHWITRMIKHTRWWCVSLPLAITLAACGVAEPALQAPTASPHTTDASAPPPARASTALPAREAPTTRSSPPAGDVPLTATLLPAPTSVVVEQLPITAEIATDAATPAPATPSASSIPPLASGAWQMYRNDRAGYSTEYPPGWTVREQANADGSFATTFQPAGDGAGITVMVMPGVIVPENDLPNTRCEQVTVGGLPGTRCFDTIALSTSVTLAGQGKTFIIAADGKHLDTQIFERFLDHFAPI
jgi:hypothetical protein